MKRDWKAEGKKYAIIAGRFQPFHEGHADLIQYALDQGLVPVVMICDITKSKRNPLTVAQRKSYIQCRFPQIIDSHIGVWQSNAKLGQEAREDVNRFIQSVQSIAPLDECIMFHLEKGVDIRDQLLDGRRHLDIQYGVLLNKPFTPLDGEVLDESVFGRVYHASDIREDFTRHRGKMYPPNADAYEKDIKDKGTRGR